MSHNISRANYAQSLNLSFLKTQTSNLNDYLDTELLQSWVSQESFKSLPRFKLIELPEDGLGAFELELLAKADQWHIPYDKTNPDFCTLEDDVHHYEYLINQTVGTDINWDYNYYDPVGLEQAIADEEDREGCYIKSLRNDYYATRGVS